MTHAEALVRRVQIRTGGISIPRSTDPFIQEIRRGQARYWRLYRAACHALDARMARTPSALYFRGGRH